MDVVMFITVSIFLKRHSSASLLSASSVYNNLLKGSLLYVVSLLIIIIIHRSVVRTVALIVAYGRRVYAAKPFKRNRYIYASRQ